MFAPTFFPLRMIFRVMAFFHGWFWFFGFKCRDVICRRGGVCSRAQPIPISVVHFAVQSIPVHFTVSPTCCDLRSFSLFEENFRFTHCTAIIENLTNTFQKTCLNNYLFLMSCSGIVVNWLVVFLSEW